MNIKKLLATVCSCLLVASSFITKSQVSAKGSGFPTCMNHYQNIAILSPSEHTARNLMSSIVDMIDASDRSDTFNILIALTHCAVDGVSFLTTKLPYYDNERNHAFQAVLRGISGINENNYLQAAEKINRQIRSKPDVVIIHLDHKLERDSFDSLTSNDELNPNSLQRQYDMYRRFMDEAGWNRDNIYVICSDDFTFNDKLDTITNERRRNRRREWATIRLNGFKERHEGWLKTLGHPYLLFADTCCNVMSPTGQFDASRALHTVEGNPESINALMDFIYKKLTEHATPIMKESNKKFRQFFFANPDEIISDVEPEEEAESEEEEAESEEEEAESEKEEAESEKEEAESEKEEPEPESKEEKFKNRKKSGWSTGKILLVGGGVEAICTIGTLATIFGRNHHKNKNKTKVPKAQKTQPKKAKVATVA